MDNFNNTSNLNYSKFREIKMEKYDIIFWIFFIMALALLIWRIFGKTPGIETLIGAILASEFALWRYMYKHGRKLAIIKTDVRSSFQFVKRDMNSIRSDINSMGKNINSDLGLIKKKLKIKN